MARIRRLRVHGVRNLSHVDLELPDQHLIWLTGRNGSGKTSLLESIYLLSRGSSFRGRRFGPVTQRGLLGSRVEAWMGRRDQRWRLRWTSTEGRVPDNAGFSVRLLGSAMQDLIEGDPSLRRRFIDWNLFHVEPGFHVLRQRYRRLSMQRNAWLSAGGHGHPVWDQEYATVVESIAHARTAFVDQLGSAFLQLRSQFSAMSNLELFWRSGLPSESELMTYLADHRQADINRGHTYLSPSRAHLSLRTTEGPWVGSRGQNKLVGVLLQLAADQVVREQGGESAVWLVDDLQAELDVPTQAVLLGMVFTVADQVLVASLDGSSASTRLLDSVPFVVFHVEQGRVQRLENGAESIPSTD